LSGPAGFTGNSAAFSPDGLRVLTIGRDSLGRLWDAGTGRLAAILEPSLDDPRIARFSPDGLRIAIAYRDGVARVWDSASGKLLVSLEGHADSVVDVSFSPDGSRLATVGQDEVVKVWDLPVETRSAEQIARLVRCRAPWRLEDGRLVPAEPDAAACDDAEGARSVPPADEGERRATE
jgi:WD40 repeat protein